ncbi:MAG TPA: transglycosylase domain-containing protein [Egibacteraceae bacterium]|nr:transglycosylase domain-containing protein [Egibacteraceae bacterium]
MRRRVVLWVLAAVTLLALAGGAAAWRAAHAPVTLPPPAASSQILAADGSVLATLHGEQDRVPVPLERVPKVLRDAVIAAEDARFADHGGVDLRATLRALWRNIRAGEATQGGSTITQQLAKNLVTGAEPTLGRKLREAWTAVRIEASLSKDEILERYLNTVYFGGGAYGVQAASQRWFAKDVDDLELPDAALLAGLLRAPSGADPVRHPERARRARARVLDRMVAEGLVGRAEAEAVRRADLGVVETPPDWRAPWFVDHVLDTLRDDDRFAALGQDADARLDRLFRQGLRVETTLDPVWQAAAERAVREVVHEPGDPYAAVVAVDPRDGALRALVGGRRYGDPGDPVSRFNLATRGRRQAGSAFKPLVLAAALSRGHTLDDRFPAGRSVSIALPGDVAPWVVRNYDERAYGELALRDATRLSVNTVYARLVMDVGAEAVAELARVAGVGRPLRPYPSIALGTQEVTPLEMAAVQATFAAGGVRRPVVAVRRVTDAGGAVLYEAEPARGRRVLPEGVAALVTEALQDVVRRGTGQAAAIGRPVAGKTGTTQNWADAWFAGYTPRLAAAVWVGFPQAAEPMTPPRTRERVEGGGWPAEIFAAFADAALSGVPAGEFAAPPGGVVRVEVDRTRNCLPNAYTPQELVELRSYVPGSEPTEHCTEPSGPYDARVPDVVGLPFEAAARLLGGEGLLVARRAELRADLPPGRVVRQSPDADSPLSPDPALRPPVTVWVSAGAEVTVPDVLGLELERAVAELEGRGLLVQVRQECPGAGRDCSGARLRPGTVWEQSPDAGRRVHFGAQVTLFAYPA